jgi:hypothetical protein
MSSVIRAFSAAAVAAGVFLLIGCSGGEARVSGTVEFDDKPLTTGMVSFHPVGSGPVALGKIDESGRYTAVVGAGGGLPPGDYIVTVVANEPMVPAKDPRMAPAPGKRFTPEKYEKKESSDLKYTLTSGSNTVDLKIRSK